nr:zinc knuckle CX2CX4HX4C [Tanacetum cinerariifolium]
INTPIVGPRVEKNKGNGLNLNDPSMSTAGLTRTTSVFTRPTTKNGGEKVGNERVMNELPSSYANKLSHTSSSMANLHILEANVPNDTDYDVWLPLASVHKVNDIMKNSLSVTLLEKDLLSPLWNGLCVTIEKIRDNLIMAVPNLEGTRYTKEDIRVEYEWEPSRCSTCLIFC